jgi:hypothetical protein
VTCLVYKTKTCSFSVAVFSPSSRKFVVFTATSDYIAARIIHASGSFKKTMSSISRRDRSLSITCGQASRKSWCSFCNWVSEVWKNCLIQSTTLTRKHYAELCCSRHHPCVSGSLGVWTLVIVR